MPFPSILIDASKMYEHFSNAALLDKNTLSVQDYQELRTKFPKVTIIDFNWYHLIQKNGVGIFINLSNNVFLGNDRNHFSIWGGYNSAQLLVIALVVKQSSKKTRFSNKSSSEMLSSKLFTKAMKIILRNTKMWNESERTWIFLWKKLFLV